ncbi:MAG: DUF937 domain-containing protein [Nocardioidaceae bacterium]|nr:DUF937 domain-containing protein [Nocardioidaceae bacterium]
MSDPTTDILAGLPLDDLAARLGADPASVRSAAEAAIPALLGGLHANAQDSAGADSIAEALTQHEGQRDPDPADGAKIAGHIFGDSQDQVVQQLGGVQGVSGDLVKKLIPLLAPLVLAYLAKQVGGRAGSGSAGDNAGGGVVGSILEEVLKGASQGSGGGQGAGSIIGDVLGGLLGRGRR